MSCTVERLGVPPWLLYSFILIISSYLPVGNCLSNVNVNHSIYNIYYNPSTNVLYAGTTRTIVAIKIGDMRLGFPPAYFLDEDVAGVSNKGLFMWNNQLFSCANFDTNQCQSRPVTNFNNVTRYSKITDKNVVPEKGDVRSVFVLASRSPREHTLIVASGNSDKPAIITVRQLTNGVHRMDIFADDFDMYTSIRSFKQEAQVIFVDGFATKDYVHFLYNVKGESNNWSSKISMSCIHDVFLSYFVQTEMKCGNMNEGNKLMASAVFKASYTLASELNIGKDDDVLVASFRKTSGDSIMCFYPVEKIEKVLMENVDQCVRNRSAPTMSIMGSTYDIKCGTDLKQADGKFCGFPEQEKSIAIEGIYSLHATSAFTLSKRWVKAITVAEINGENVFFLTTQDNKSNYFEKIYARNGKNLISYFKEHISQPPVASQMYVDSRNENILYAAGSVVYRRPIKTCSLFKSCDVCLSKSDPYCGWCSLENRCSVRENCSNYTLANRWLRGGSCPRIEHINPIKVPVDGPSDNIVSMEVSRLPAHDASFQYKCQFGNITTNVTFRNSTHVTCDLPKKDNLDGFNKGELKVMLRLFSSKTSISIVSLEFTFFNCSSFATCTSCSQSIHRCQWCLMTNKCSYKCKDSQAHSDFKMIVATEKQSCPLLNGRTTPTRIHVNHNQNIQIEGKNFPEIKGGKLEYRCRFIIGNHETESAAQRIDNQSVICKNVNLFYSNRTSGIMHARVQLLWSENFLIDDEFGLEIETYNCGILGQDCGLCISLDNSDKNYECMYCSSCVWKHSGSHCANPAQSISQCPIPEVTGIEPQSGPTEGKTLLSVKGTNLGSKFDDIEWVKVGGKTCILQKEKYQVAKVIVCIIPNGAQDSKGIVSLKLYDKAAVQSSMYFYYKKPFASRLQPSKGPTSGGTRVEIFGHNLDIGNQVSVYFSSAIKFTCNQSRSHAKVLVCYTPKNDKRIEKKRDATISIDGTEILEKLTFHYEDDPVISRIEPRRIPKSGGIVITIEGKDFDVIQVPQFYLFKGNIMTEKKTCIKESAKMLKCLAPQWNEESRQRRAAGDAEFTEVHSGLLMDGVLSTRNISINGTNQSFKIYPNPLIHPFSDGYRGYSQVLGLEGANLDNGVEKKHYDIQIGDIDCEVQTLTSNGIWCRIKADDEEDLKGKPVIVKIGNNLVFNPGKIKLSQIVFPHYAIIGVAIGGGTLLMIIIVILILCRQKSTQASRQYKKMQLQLDTLESNVRNECKQAFAELQTEVSDLTSDLDMTGIPFCDFKTYAFRVLFPSRVDHPIMHNGSVEMRAGTAPQAAGLHQFNQLLNSKHFLIVFVRTLEMQKNFSIRDKAMVAALLMVVLQDKMEYATEILKSLLDELIDKSVENKNPKLMLRRTESVVEKLLTNWLSLCMHGYLKKHAGRGLFILYKAIKQQTEKGPVDALFSEARYSLSEDKLLREKLEPDPCTLTLYLHNKGAAEPIQCKVLDCDTITQAKEKALDSIYMNTPWSRRPKVHDVELEWKSGRRGLMPLRDEDCTTVISKGGWKKINTLAHYNVSDAAEMVIVHRPNRGDYVHHVNGKIEISPGNNLTQPIVMIEEKGLKPWHLIKKGGDNAYISRTQKVISEIFLTRLLSTKGTIQQFVDDLFMTILRVDESLPPAVKYLFDFLDKAAQRHNISDIDVVHTWKSNSLPLRFWVNIIKNPEFVFDIHKSYISDSCLSVIAQVFMESCSTSELRLGKDSPSNKLLFARDIPRYRKWVKQYYQDIANMSPVTEKDMNRAMTDLSMTNLQSFNVQSALQELFKFASQYSYELLDALNDDIPSRRMKLAQRFEQVVATCKENVPQTF